MLRSNPNGDLPKVHASAYIDPAAVVIGDVTVGRNVFIGPGAIVRADEEGSAIVLGDNCNVQDRVIIHALAHSRVVVGKGSSLAHGCVVHGPCRIGPCCFIGFGSVIMEAVLGAGVVVRHLAVIEGVRVPSNIEIGSTTLVIDTARRDLPRVPAQSRAFSRKVAHTNLALARGYKQQAGR